MSDSKASVMKSASEAIDKKVGYFKFGIIGTEVLDSTDEMLPMMDMMLEMMKKDIETSFMVNNSKVMEFSTDVVGGLTNFSIYDHNTKMKEAFGELDMEKVYTVYDKSIAEEKPIPAGTTFTEDEETKVIHGYNCTRITMHDKELKMVAYLTKEIPMESTFPNGIEGFPMEVQLQMGGLNIITGIMEYSPKLPNPEFFNVDKSAYRKVTNEEFPSKRGMF